MRINNDVIDVLANSAVTGNNLFLPDGQLDRKLYVAVDKALTALGGKWNRKEKAHVFGYCPDGAIEELLQTGEYTDAKKEFQFFETPPELAQRMVDLAGLKFGDRVLEPSAGRGAIAERIRACDVTLRCIELNQDNRECLINEGYTVLKTADFLGYDPEEPVDVIVMNPPFSSQQDVSHITHAISIAQRCVVAIASASILFRTNRKTADFRALLDEYDSTIEALPVGTFKASGTMVNTCLIKVFK